MGIAPFLKEIGRGKDGARPLTQEQAEDVFGRVLDRSVSDLEVGAFLMAMRIKGESDAELAGFLAAVQARSLNIALPRAAVLLPSYNGARKLPNLTPLLAALLAREGVPVLVHGQRRDPTRVTSAEVFDVLGWGWADGVPAVQATWAAGRPAFLPLDVLCPALSALLDIRWTIGLRGPGHTICKLLQPTTGAPALRVVSYTHPEYGRGHQSFLQMAGATAMLMRGTEGEPVADPRRQPKAEVFVHGQPRPELSLEREDGVLAEVPLLPDGYDAPTTAAYIRDLLDGRLPVPAPITKQVRACVAALEAARQAPAAAPALQPAG
jgi:anthranilate phosphoribosyltransferase